MKNFLIILMFVAGMNAFAQVQVSQGDNSLDLKLSKPPVFISFSTRDADYFVLRREQGFTKINTLLAADKNGQLLYCKEVMPKIGMSIVFDVKDLLVVGDNPVLFVQTRDGKTGKNTLTAYGIDKNGILDVTGINIASVDYTKLGNAGEWYTALTPDKKHVAVLLKAPHEKNMADHFKCVMLDEHMKEVSNAEVSFGGDTKEISIANFLASDKGDLYLLSDQYDGSYKFPLLYKYSGGQGTIIPVMISDPGTKNLNYLFSVNPSGDLIIAGYTQKKSTFSAGDPKATGVWSFNSSKINEVKTAIFDKATTNVTNLTARNIVYNGDTFYLIGEQYVADKKRPEPGFGMNPGADQPAKYTHGDILATAFSNDGIKKFDIPVSRKWPPADVDYDLSVASGVIQGKLVLVYNDEYSKYIETTRRQYYKLPMAVLITNDGLMEAPVHFAKELDVKVSSYLLAPQFFSANKDKLVVLSLNAQSAKTVTFR